MARIVSLIAVIALMTFSLSPSALGRPSDAAVRAALQRDLNDYLRAHAQGEHISAISLSVSLHGRAQNINLTAGAAQYGGAGTPVTPHGLWQIGSNTKAFTAATILQLEAEGKLTIDQTVGQWLPQYPAWKDVTIRRLLDMTSGIPGYDTVPQMLADYAKNPKRNFTIAQLIAYVYPGKPHAPPPTSGYNYSNTNYLLAELIIERAGGERYSSELGRRFFNTDLGLGSTYYSAAQYPATVVDRMVSGYFYSHDPDNAGLAPLLGRDVRNDSVSWMQGAGGIVSTPEDLTRWARALYAGPILPPKQRAELMTLVSIKTGKPLKTTGSGDPQGFGLGVAQVTTPQTGTVWFYEGMTLGYRMIHLYFPRQDAVIAFGLNSQPDAKQNQSRALGIAVYETLHKAGLL
ncbi:MAG: beta-lactamase family protein [Candidatus Eremiobacteraeota bacterium]|nr:beta-lactamase family protein [Candidatus Eremiobacteraeota bacterium]